MPIPIRVFLGEAVAEGVGDSAPDCLLPFIAHRLGGAQVVVVQVVEAAAVLKGCGGVVVGGAQHGAQCK